MRKPFPLRRLAVAACAGLLTMLQIRNGTAQNTPPILWADNVWTDARESTKGIFTDAAGNVYSATEIYFGGGSAASPTLDCHIGPFLLPHQRPLAMFNSGSARLEDMVLAKYSPTGSVLWAKRSLGRGRERINNIAPAPGNQFVAAGEIAGDTAAFFGNTTYFFPNQPGGFRGMLAKFDTSGNVIWEKMFPANFTNYSLGGIEPSGIKVKDAKCDAAGNIIALMDMDAYSTTIDGVTFTNMRRPGVTNPDADVLVAKFSPSGSLLWGTLIGTDHEDYPGFRLELDPAGNAYFTPDFFGDTIRVNGMAAFYNTAGIYTLKLHGTNGSLAWAKSTQSVQPVDLAVDTSANVYVAGYYATIAPSRVFGSDTLPGQIPGQYGGKMALLKYDRNGNEIWARTGSKTGVIATSHIPAAVKLDKSGCIYLTGNFTDSNFRFDKTNVILTNNNSIARPTYPISDIYLAKYNEAGTLLWARKAGDSSSEYSKVMALDTAGNVFIGGAYDQFTLLDGTYLTGGDYIADDAFIMKLASTSGNCYPPPAGVSDEPLEKMEVLVYPNPNDGHFAVECTALPEAELTLIDAVGRVVYQSRLHMGRTKMEIPLPASGVYLLRLQQSGQALQQRMVISGK